MSRGWSIEGRIPPIKAVMRPFPYWVELGSTAGQARSLMAEHGIRHLPVRDGSADDAESLVGIVSDRDLRGVAEGVPLAEVMSAPVVHVDMERPLDEVLATLAEDRIGCVLVTRGGRVAGIFTTTDACRLLWEAFAPLSKWSGDGNEVA